MMIDDLHRSIELPGAHETARVLPLELATSSLARRNGKRQRARSTTL